MKKETRDAIKNQALKEIAFARTAKQGVIAEWHKNEIVLKKMLSDGERSNVDLGEGISFVNTFLSKINSPYNFKYKKGSDADLMAAKIVNAIKEKDAKRGRWKFKAMLARTELVQYGRYVFEYHADSVDGYKSHLTNVPVYQFLIDPSAGGEDIEKAFYLGRGGIVKTQKQIEDGVKSGLYLRAESKNLLTSVANAAEKTREEKEAENRWVQIIANNSIMAVPGQWKFWEWYTTYEGVRYYVLITETGGEAIRIEALSEIFADELYPFFSVAAYPEIGQFWTPAPLATVRDAIMGKATAINQMLDNGEAINRPMKGFDVATVKNPALLKFRKDGLIPFKGGTDLSKAVQLFPVVPLTTSIEVYDKLDSITSTQSGVNNGARGNADEQKVGIYEGNQQNASDRFSLIGDSEADGQARFAQLYLNGLEEHMTSKIAVEMIGIDGVEYKQVSKKDIKHDSDFEIEVVTAGTEETMQGVETKNKLTFLQGKALLPPGGANPFNPKVLGELEATIAGFSADEVKRLLDTKDDANAEIMSEAARDIRSILDGEDIEPNQIATNSYKQKIVDYMRDEQENISNEQATRLALYIESLDPIIMRNMMKSINDTLSTEGLPTMQGLSAGFGGQAVVPGALPPPAPVAPAPLIQ